MPVGVYQLTVQRCGKKYTKQTGQGFAIKYTEHLHSFKTNSNTSKLVQYTLNTSYSFAIIEDVNRHVQFRKKGHHTNTTEKLNIYKQTPNNYRINDILTFFI